MNAIHRVVMVACAALLLVPVMMKSRTGQGSPDRAAFRVLSSGTVPVKISGDVHHPGMYMVPANSLAVSVIKMAEPIHPPKRYKADAYADLPLRSGSVVMLELLADGSHHIAVAGMTVPERMMMGLPLDISTMSEADFDRLPGIGPALAKRITEYRQNNGDSLSVKDLSKVEGIGEKKYRMILPYFQPAVIK